MAENKKSFLLYTDLLEVFEKLKQKESHLLIMHILRYVNDKNPTAPDRMTELLFEPIKQQLKRDLKKYESIKKRKSDAGKLGMEKRWHNKDTPPITGDNSVISVITEITDSVNVSVTDNVNVNEIVGYFKENGYPASYAKKFYEHYKQNGWTDKVGNPVTNLNWKSKAQGGWFRIEDESKKEKQPKKFTKPDYSKFDQK